MHIMLPLLRNTPTTDAYHAEWQLQRSLNVKVLKEVESLDEAEILIAYHAQ
jgi:hypothetical protein